MRQTPLMIMEDLLNNNHPEIAMQFSNEYNEEGHWNLYVKDSIDSMNAFLRYKLLKLGDVAYSVRRSLFRSADLNGWRENIQADVLEAIVLCYA